MVATAPRIAGDARLRPLECEESTLLLRAKSLGALEIDVAHGLGVEHVVVEEQLDVVGTDADADDLPGVGLPGPDQPSSPSAIWFSSPVVVVIAPPGTKSVRPV